MSVMKRSLFFGRHNKSSEKATTTAKIPKPKAAKLLDLEGSCPEEHEEISSHQSPPPRNQGPKVRSPDGGHWTTPNHASSRHNGPETVTLNQTTFSKRPVSETELRIATFNPPRTNYPGDYGFCISFQDRDYVPQNINYTYSSSLNRLFVKLEEPCTVVFHCSKQPPYGAVVRGMMVYVDEHETVNRCPNHLLKDVIGKQQCLSLSQHVLQAVVHSPYRNQASYDASCGRFSVLVPYIFPRPADGEGFMVQYKFMCLSTCVGGINRRRMLAVFTLEDPAGSVLGRSCFEVKVCTCPGRDRPRDEAKRIRAERSDHILSTPLQYAREELSTSSSYRMLKVKTKHYKLFSLINDALNAADNASDELRSYIHEREQKRLLDEQPAMCGKDN